MSALHHPPRHEADLPRCSASMPSPAWMTAPCCARGGAGAVRRFARYPDYVLYVAEHEAMVVGTFALLVMDNLGHMGAPSAIVEDVVVDPGQQGLASARR